MQLSRILRASLCGLLSVGCSSAQVEPKSAAPECSANHGLGSLRVFIANGSRNDLVAFSNAGITRSNASEWPSADRNNNARRNFHDPDGAEFSSKFPAAPRTTPHGERLSFPASYSPDNRILAAALVTLDPTAAQIAIREASQIPKTLILKSEDEEHRLESANGFSYYALAWKPDSSQMAAIELNYDRTPRSLPALITPHGGIVYSDVLLRVYDRKGSLVCQSLLASKAANTSVSLDWSDK